jgi:cation/acetate symporter
LVIAASCNLPILLLSLYWPRLTTAGAMAGGLVGLMLSVCLVMLGPKVWMGAFGHPKPLFPYDYPTLIALAAALAVAVGVSLSTRRAHVDSV